jgi:predicted transglutaminase-like cysteine proteinase
VRVVTLLTFFLLTSYNSYSWFDIFDGFFKQEDAKVEKKNKSEAQVDFESFEENLSYIVPNYKSFSESIKNEMSPAIRVKKVSSYIRSQVTYISDSYDHGKKDKWQGPYEFFLRKRGDCEDYALASYYLLRNSGIPKEHLGVAHLIERNGGEAHAIALFFPNGDKSKAIAIDNNPPYVYKYEKAKSKYVQLLHFNEDQYAIGDNAKYKDNPDIIKKFAKVRKEQLEFHDFIETLKFMSDKMNNKDITALLQAKKECFYLKVH